VPSGCAVTPGRRQKLNRLSCCNAKAGCGRICPKFGRMPRFEAGFLTVLIQRNAKIAANCNLCNQICGLRTCTNGESAADAKVPFRHPLPNFQARPQCRAFFCPAQTLRRAGLFSARRKPCGLPGFFRPPPPWAARCVSPCLRRALGGCSIAIDWRRA